MHGVGAVQKIVEVVELKETLLTLHVASDRKQAYVSPNRLWSWDSVVGIMLRVARTGVRIPAGSREICLLQILKGPTKPQWVKFTLEQAMKAQRGS